MGKFTGVVLTALLLLPLAACDRDGKREQDTKQAAIDVNFLAEDAAWRAQRKEELLKPDGWTSLVGLHWLELKAHYLGSGAGSGIRLAVGPPKMGLLEQRDGRIFLHPRTRRRPDPEWRAAEGTRRAEDRPRRDSQHDRFR